METHEQPAGGHEEEPRDEAPLESDRETGTSPAESQSTYVQAWPPPTPPQPRTPGDDEPGPLPAQPQDGPGAAQPAAHGGPGYAQAYGPGPQGAGLGGPGPQGSGPQGPGPHDRPYGQAAFGEQGYGPGPAYGPPGGHPRGTTRRKAAAGGLALALILGGGLAGGAVAAVIGGGTTYASPTAVSPAASRSATGVAAIAQAVQPSTVSITVAAPQGQGEGAGVVIRSDGMILTNNHVVSAATGGGQIGEKFTDGKKVPAQIVG